MSIWCCEDRGYWNFAEFPHPSTKRRHLLPEGEGTEVGSPEEKGLLGELRFIEVGDVVAAVGVDSVDRVELVGEGLVVFEHLT
jgi:hypothetical protein